MWSHRSICEACAGAIESVERRCALEQSPYGVDALDELQIHAALVQGLKGAGFNPLSEQRYPDHRARRRRSEGDRCDLVLLPESGEHLTDPLAADSLFGKRGVDPADAYWLEVKMARQFALTDGVAGAARQYGAQLLSASTSDVRKLAQDRVIEFAALLLLFFTSDEPTANHDLNVWLSRCLDKHLPVAAPFIERRPVTDRIGNTLCTIALVPVGRSTD